MKKLIIYILINVTLLTSCNNQQSENLPANDQNKQTVIDTISLQSSVSSNWLENFDLDGDSINDKIYFDFSEGAHCCYKINIVLSSDRKERNFPFEMDGGYEMGVDNSQPNQFDIRDIDNDGLPEILMQIETYNGESSTIPTKWKSEYGITSNNIVIEFDTNDIVLMDYEVKLKSIDRE